MSCVYQLGVPRRVWEGVARNLWYSKESAGVECRDDDDNPLMVNMSVSNVFLYTCRLMIYLSLSLPPSLSPTSLSLSSLQVNSSGTAVSAVLKYLRY